MRILFGIVFAGALLAQQAVTVKRASVKKPAVEAPAPPTAEDIANLGKLVEQIQKEALAEKSAVVLNETAKAAVEVSNTWVGASNIPEAGRDGRVNFTFGSGLPIIVCAPLHVCSLELQPGEHVTGEPALGDAVRWDVSPRTVGRDLASQTLVIIKPKSAGLDTNLVLTTDRRAYYLRLVSDPVKYTARVGFEYPDEQSAAWRAEIARKDERPEQAAAPAPIQIVPDAATGGNYEVRLTKGKDKSLKPLKVTDDGNKTFIQMPPSTAHADLPVLLIQPPVGKPELVNFRVAAGNVYVVDRLFDHAILKVGVGKAERKAEIFRKN